MPVFRLTVGYPETQRRILYPDHEEGSACHGGIRNPRRLRCEPSEKIEDFPVQKLVHSLAVDPSTHRVYAPEQEEEGRPVARMVIYELAERKLPKR
jgi:hypothetical protein